MDPQPAANGPAPPPADRCTSVPVIDGTPLPMVEIEGAEHLICGANPAFCALVHRPRAELIGTPLAGIVADGGACSALLDRICAAETATDRSHNPAIWLQAMWPTLEADRRAVRVVVQMTPEADLTRRTVQMNEALLVGGLRQHELRMLAELANARLELEVTERIRVEGELVAAEARLRAHSEYLEQAVKDRTARLSEAIGDMESFSYSLVHDLRAPLRAIHGFTQMALETPGNVVPAAAEMLRRVVRAASRMDSLIQDVLCLSQVIRQPITLSPIDVDGLVHALVAERPELGKPRAEITIASPLQRVLGHEASLSQCLTNLLSNAVKFVQPGVVPHVNVWTEVIAGPATTGTPAPDPASTGRPCAVRIWVEDQGIGIAAKSRETIFEIFQRLHSNAVYEGSGIGLAIVRKAIERMNGRVGVESRPGGGSRFWFELPPG